ncbi:tetratricopeptide repeat-containing sensor histidine kinase [Marivirga sericea]|uniref:tetratricopeptide repeat-containing sensor histidine kinase n=1 Tax=Marivirga sericea TaxID=1028 RepID=UPI00111C6731|nr:histidine kinase dimerization/phosphoacceptor domain -containing protein [Marivirga sericea]
MKLLLIFILFFNISFARAQQGIDSLNALLSNPLDQSQKAYLFDELSYQWFYENLDSSLFYGVIAYSEFSKLNDPQGLSQAATSVAVAHHYLNNWDSAVLYYKEALSIREANKSTRIASSLNNLGVVFMDQEDYEEAMKYYIKAMEVRELSNDTIGVALTKINLGLIFKKQSIFNKALSYYKESIETLEKFNQQKHLEVALLNMGAIYNTLKEYDTAKLYNIKLRNLASQRSSQRNLAKSFVNLANSYQGLGFLDSSLYYANKGLKFFEAQNDTLNMANSLLSITQSHFEGKNYKTVIAYSKRLEQLNKIVGNMEIAIENQLMLAKAFAALNDYENAYSKLENSFYLKDSFLTTSLNETISDLTVKYETEQKEKEISQLKITTQDSIIAEQEAANQRNLLLFLAGFLILGAILLFLLLRTKSKSNAIIGKSLSEKETLLKEIHHRVKNNLQVISSLLSLQSRFIEDKDAKALVNEGQNRVKSMALIHQKLYQKDNLTGVEAADYIQNLTSTLCSTYGIDMQKVDVTYDVDHLNLDVDTMIPIGLILNELISNSFKYAFPSGEGTLSITLKEKEKNLILSVKDNGIGSTQEINMADSFGMRMIQSLARKLEAEVDFDLSDGTKASLTITHYKLYNY